MHHASWMQVKNTWNTRFIIVSNSNSGNSYFWSLWELKKTIYHNNHYRWVYEGSLHSFPITYIMFSVCVMCWAKPEVEIDVVKFYGPKDINHKNNNFRILSDKFRHPVRVCGKLEIYTKAFLCVEGIYAWQTRWSRFKSFLKSSRRRDVLQTLKERHEWSVRGTTRRFKKGY